MIATRPSGSPRKLPADEILLADLRAGLNYAEIGRRYGVDPTNVSRRVRRMDWQERSPTARIRWSNPLGLADTPEKVVIRRHGFALGHSLSVSEFLISLPRIPTIHGHFVEGMAGAQEV